MQTNLTHTFEFKTVYFAAVSLAAAALLSGCGSTAGYKQADKTGAGIAEFRSEVLNVKAAVDGAVKALDKIAATAATDPRKAFEEYSKAVDKVESSGERAKKRAADMNARGTEYFEQWEKQLATVGNPEIRKLADERKTKLRETFGAIKTSAQEAKDTFPPFLSDLKDLRTFLSNDITVSGVDAAKGAFVKAKESGVKCQKGLDTLIAELNTVSAAITPAVAKK